jgi:glycosyltransferase involved in cell wall biosynthesis
MQQPISKRLHDSLLDSSQALTACVLPDIDPKWGGPSVSVPALCRAMHAQDPSVRLYFAADVSDPDWPACFQRYSKSYGGLLHASRGLRTALAAGNFRVVHHHALWLPSLGYAARAARRSGCPLVISPRGMLAAYALRRARWKKWFAARLLHRGALARAAAWHATSDMEFTDIRAAGFCQPILVSGNGIDEPRWSEPLDRQRWLARHPELAGKRLALFYSRLHSKKGLLPLVDAWARLAPSFPDWHLLICGSAHEYTLDDVARAVRGHPRLVERTTLADPAGLPKPYRLAELYLLPTLSENFGLTIGEALACGVAALTSTAAPWSGLNDRDAGRCVPLDTFEAHWAELMKLAPDALRDQGARGREWMLTDFSWDRKASEMLDFYQQLTDK